MITSSLKNYSKDFLSLFYPNLCLACQQNTPQEQNIVCLSCEHYLPRTNYHLQTENPFTERFWGRFPLNAATSLYIFTKESPVQNLLHQLKYKGKEEIGLKTGVWLGKKLSQTTDYQTIDCIVPVPLHPKKEQIRGYNQSERFGQGLSNAMDVPCIAHGLRRKSMTETQTQKNKFERFDNIQSVFEVNKAKDLENKHILLVDDVLTTGATIESCATELLKINGVRLSIATIAIVL